MSTHDHSMLHADHRRWQSETKSWRDDIGEWQHEREKLFADLRTALEAEVSGLETHASTIAQHDEHVLQHEGLIADLARSGRPAPNEMESRMAEAHYQEADKHETMRAVHDRLKHHHHRAMARLVVVLKALSREPDSSLDARFVARR